MRVVVEDHAFVVVIIRYRDRRARIPHRKAALREIFPRNRVVYLVIVRIFGLNAYPRDIACGTARVEFVRIFRVRKSRIAFGKILH